jgi:hypothetical protein
MSTNAVGAIYLFINAPLAKTMIFFNGCISATYQYFDKPIFILSCMDPTNTDNIFSYLCQIIFLQYEFQRGYFFNAEFLLFIVNKKV